MQLLRQSTAATRLVGPVLDSGGTAFTTAVIGDFSVTKNGTTTAMASPATATHVHNGCYAIALTTGNTDTLGGLDISCNKSGYAMSVHRYQVVPFDATSVTRGFSGTAIPDVGFGLAGGFANSVLLDSATHSSGYYSATSTQYAFTAGGSVPSAHGVTGGLKGRLFSIISGAGAGQDRVISNSSVSVGVLILTFETAFEVTPDNTSVWVIWRDRRPVLDSSLRVKALDSNGVVFDSTDLGASAVWAAATRTLTSTMQATVTSPFIATKDLPAIPLGSGPSFQWTVVDSSGNAIDLSAKTVRFVVASADSGTDEFSKYDDTLTGEFQYQSGLVISGGSSNVVTVQTDSDDITAIGSGEHRYWLWDVTTAGAERVLVKGKFPVEPAVRSV
jgi:hypothetical protein